MGPYLPFFLHTLSTQQQKRRSTKHNQNSSRLPRGIESRLWTKMRSARYLRRQILSRNVNDLIVGRNTIHPNILLCPASSSVGCINHESCRVAPIQHGHHRYFATGTIRRRRQGYEKYNNPQLGTGLPTGHAGLEEPFEYSGDSLDEYSEKATLSPWTPVPDSVARKIFDRADVQPDDVHVELGSGDGRVNFFAIEAGVERSIGVDVDEEIVKVANERLNRIHPKPNLEFVVADLMRADSPVWEEVKNATILTMYFTKQGLEKIRPMIENALRGRRCRVFTCGYPMPDWNSQMVETVLDMPIHFYDWGNTDNQDTFMNDSRLHDMPPPQDPFRAKDMDKFLQSKKSNFVPDSLPGYHPDDRVDYHWDDFDGQPTDGENKEKE